MRDIAIVSPFSEFPNKSVDFSALAEYTAVLLNTFPREYRERITIFSQKSENGQEYNYNDVLINPTWKRNSPLYIFQIFKKVLPKNIKVVHVQHEVYAYGSNQFISPYLMNLLLLLLKLAGKRVVITIHGVVPFSSLNKDFLTTNKVKAPGWAIKAGLFVLMYPIVLFVDKAIVHNANIKKYLVTDYRVNSEKVTIIPLPMFKFKNDQKSPKFLIENLNSDEKVVLFFGFLAGYKGLDILVDGLKYLNLQKDNFKVLIAGSKPKRLAEDPSYNSWLDNLINISTHFKENVLWDIRHIPDDELEAYFDKSHLVLIPYKECLSSSGPITYALMKNIPVLVSDVFRDVVQEDLIYGHTSQDLAEHINKFFNESTYREKLMNAVSKQRELWEDKIISDATLNLYRKMLGE